jgi:hypothetical protein
MNFEAMQARMTGRLHRSGLMRGKWWQPNRADQRREKKPPPNQNL